MQFSTQVIVLALAAMVAAAPSPKISQQEIDKVIPDSPSRNLNSSR